MKLFKNLIYLTLLLFFVCACKKEKDSELLNKNQRLESLFEGPIKINSHLDKFYIDKIKFHKSYILLENNHGALKQDSVIRFASTNDDIIEVFKNKHMDKIIFLRFSSKNLTLNHGIKIGMSYSQFFDLLPNSEPVFDCITYQNDYSTLKFVFGTKSKKLKIIKCNYYLD